MRRGRAHRQGRRRLKVDEAGAGGHLVSPYFPEAGQQRATITRQGSGAPGAPRREEQRTGRQQRRRTDGDGPWADERAKRRRSRCRRHSAGARSRSTDIGSLRLTTFNGGRSEGVERPRRRVVHLAGGELRPSRSRADIEIEARNADVKLDKLDRAQPAGPDQRDRRRNRGDRRPERDADRRPRDRHPGRAGGRRSAVDLQRGQRARRTDVPSRRLQDRRHRDGRPHHRR